MTRQLVVISLIFSLIPLSGCVGKKKYDAAVKDLENTKMELAKARKKHAKEKADLESKIKAQEDRIAQLKKKIEAKEKKVASLEENLQEAKGTLQMYESEQGSLEEKLNATKDELAKLREKQRQQRERLSKYRELAKRLADTFESGQLSVKVRDGKMVIEMSDDILFNSGRARVNDSGKKVLSQLAEVLQDIGDREFLVAGHTDDVPLGSGRFEDNWELSTARASNVVRFLSEKGVNPDSLAAAGYSKFDPIASNEKKEGRAKNRRIEIILMPKVEELPNLPKDLFASDDS